MKSLTEAIHLVYGFKPGDHNAAGISTDSVNVKNYGHLTLFLLFAALTGDSVLTVKQAATNGGTTTAVPFRTRLAADVQGDADGADTYGALSAAVTTLTLAAATYANKLLVVEVDLEGLTDAQPWITVNVSDAASALNVACMMALSAPRYKANVMPAATE